MQQMFENLLVSNGYAPLPLPLSFTKGLRPFGLPASPMAPPNLFAGYGPVTMVSMLILLDYTMIKYIYYLNTSYWRPLKHYLFKVSVSTI